MIPGSWCPVSDKVKALGWLLRYSEIENLFQKGIYSNKMRIAFLYLLGSKISWFLGGCEHLGAHYLFIQQLFIEHPLYAQHMALSVEGTCVKKKNKCSPSGDSV